MAQALAASWQLMPEFKLYASSPSLPNAINDDGVHTYNDNISVVSQCDIIILAVKPKQAEDVLKQIAAKLRPDSVLISVVAGLSLQSLMGACKLGQSIVRTMPNLPVSKGMGATPLLANVDLLKAHHLLVEKLFSSVGIITWVDSDDLVDRFTALSGSGPAYILYFLESLISHIAH